MNRLPSKQKIITIFGSSDVQGNVALFDDSVKLGFELAKQGYCIRSGGQDLGGGIMSGVSIGASKANQELEQKVDIQAIILKDVWNPAIKECTQSYASQNLGSRTDDLCAGASAFIVMPGGKGTLLELCYILNGKDLPEKNDSGEELSNYKNSRIYVYGQQWKQILELSINSLGNFGVKKESLNYFKFVNSSDEIIQDIKQNPI